MILIMSKIIYNELKKDFLITWSYKAQWAGELLSLTVFYFFISRFGYDSPIGSIAYAIWFFSILIINDISNKISNESQIGTLEQVYMSCTPIPVLFILRIVAAVVRAITLMGCLFVPICLIQKNVINLSSIYYALLSILVTLPGLVGMSLFLGGMTLILKDLGWFKNILNNALLFMSGAFISLDTIPKAFQIVAWMLPTTQTLECFINLQDGHALASIVRIIVIGSVYFFMGLIFFCVCDRHARINGSLGHY